MSTPAARDVIGITVGDPAGIGPEITVAALRSGLLDPDFDYRVVGSPARVTSGVPTRDGAQLAWDNLEEAVRLVRGGELQAVVTGPVCKAGLYDVGFEYPGQTEFFAARCGVQNFAMLLAGGALTVALTSIHLPLRRAIENLSAGEIVRVGGLLADYLRCRLDRPARIAVAGLNPHAGEQGNLGMEEVDLIEPAVNELQKRFGGFGATFEGPLSPDTVFHQAVHGQWDAVLCMYHDQGLIPLKLHAFHEGVNITWGLPIIRTSPDHGTAFSLAGQGKAHPGSMIEAIKLAALLVKRKRNLHLSTTVFRS